MDGPKSSSMAQHQKGIDDSGRHKQMVTLRKLITLQTAVFD